LDSMKVPDGGEVGGFGGKHEESSQRRVVAPVVAWARARGLGLEGVGGLGVVGA